MIQARMHLTLWLVVWTVIPGIPCVNAATEAGYTSLFNGKDLTGWTPMGVSEAFTVKDGAIYTTGARPYPSWLRSTAAYENFILRFEYQTEGWYEGGILLHAPLEGPGSKLGFKIHLRHDRKAYGLRSPGAIYDAAAPTSIANLPSGQWNQCEIECRWPQLRVTLNGERIHGIAMDREKAFKHRLRRGFIGIQNIGCRASFRNIRIRALPDQEQWTSLFAAGMESLVTQGHSQWRIQNNVLTGQGNDGAAYTREAFADPFELQVWVKTTVNGNGGVLFHSGPGRVEVQCFNAPDSTNPTGSLYGIVPAGRVVSRDQEWFLLQIFSHGPHARVLVNGEDVSATDALKPPYQGPIGFQQHTPGGSIHYRGARIKSLDSDIQIKN